MQLYINVPTFPWNLLPPPSGRKNQGEKSELLAHVWETVDVNGDIFKPAIEGQVFTYQNMMSLLRSLAYP
jgi:hypothetical protein